MWENFIKNGILDFSSFNLQAPGFWGHDNYQMFAKKKKKHVKWTLLKREGGNKSHKNMLNI